jgi:hypothetical protein
VNSTPGNTTDPNPAWRVIRGILRLLLGFVFMSSLTLPCIFAISEGVAWSDWFNTAEEIRIFLGNWTSVCLLFGIMAIPPFLGLYLIAGSCISFKRWVVARKATKQ